VAVKLLEPGVRRSKRTGASALQAQPMNREFQARFTVIFLGLLTVAAVVFAGFNYKGEHQSAIPDDGVWWLERNGQVVADRLDPSGPAAVAGVRSGDIVVSVNGRPVDTSAALTRLLYYSGVYSKATYSLVRGSVPLDVEVVLVPAERSMNDWLRLIALIYLGIGLYVLLRRWTAVGSLHFYIFCLVSFIFYSLHFTGKLNTFDWIVLWSNEVAWLLQPALFLHFVLTFPERRAFVSKHRLSIPLLYLPGAILLCIQILALQFLTPSARLLWNLNRVHWGYLTVFFVSAAVVLWNNYRHATTPILRQQLKWITRGTVLAITPFTLFYVLPYLFGAMPTLVMKVTVLSLGLLPLTFGYAIVRYRLMDVDLIFKRGMAYTLAAAAIVGTYFAVVAAIAELVHTRVPSSGPYGLMVAVVVTALLFDPVRKWIQEKLDVFFYRTRYDYRRTLVGFGKELSSETDLDKMLSSLVDRLARTLLVDRLAIFLGNAESSRFELSKSFGLGPMTGVDLSFLVKPRVEDAAGHIFFENTRQLPRENTAAPRPGQDGGRRLPLQRGCATAGDLAGYIGIAVQNARLYQSLEEKAGQYERLKEFSENIVESISVGVMAVDLEDRIESWNSQMEVMFALPRREALNRSLNAVLPVAFLEEYYRVRPTQASTISTNSGWYSERRNPHRQHRHRAAGEQRLQRDWPPDHRRRHHRAHRTGIAALAGGEAFLHRLAGCRRGARGEHPAGRHLVVRADAGQAGAWRRQAVGLARQDHAANLPRLGDRQQPAELFAHLEHGIYRCRPESRYQRHADAAGAPVQDRPCDRAAGLASRAAADPRNTGKLQQVFLNLFLNAKDAMAGGGTLTISTSNGHRVQVRVSDTGSGIAQEHIHRIYDPFFTTKNKPTTGHSGGTGLGLSVTYGIIQEHAGKIRVDSAPGRGTTFTMEFPLIRKAVSA
jgi:two-component system, NtrC family, sensor kinase